MEQGWDKKGEGDGYEELQKIMGGRKKGDLDLGDREGDGGWDKRKNEMGD